MPADGSKYRLVSHIKLPGLYCTDRCMQQNRPKAAVPVNCKLTGFCQIQQFLLWNFTGAIMQPTCQLGTVLIFTQELGQAGSCFCYTC